MKKTKTCCFLTNDFCNFSYNLQSEARKEKINQSAAEKLETLISDGVTNFISGLEEGLDLFMSDYLLKRNEKLTLECAAAFEEQAANYSSSQREKYFEICENCDTLTFVSRKRQFGCKNKRDRYMIEQSDIVLCFWDKISPYTGELLQYAVGRNKKILYIG
ncbi:MAG: DUF1273 domain-containing protein [Ruminococcaceae bacterium]|nr:DUF1273 domain-containing protein [Oscillospiraceae bacterium]